MRWRFPGSDPSIRSGGSGTATGSGTFFVYGGYWKARPVSPPGLLENPVFGRSSNQEMLNGSQSVALEVDDYVFYRPTQSESVMLQFGDLALVRGGQIVDFWPVFEERA